MMTNPQFEKAAAYFQGKQVLITGGCGFIATHLADRLAGWGAKIRLFDFRSEYDGEYEFYSGDVRDLDALDEAMRGCDIVFHFAALLGVEKILKIPLDVLEVNELGTINALKAAVKNNVSRFVYSSSSEVYGEPFQIPVSEAVAAAPVSVYGISKLGGEAYCNAYAHTHGLEVTCLRFFNVYGPGQVDEFVISRFIARVAQGEGPTVYGTGEQVRAYTYVTDAVDGVVVAASHPNGINQTFNIGSGEVTTVAELATKAIKVSAKDLTPYFKDFGDNIRTAAREIYKRVPDTTKAKNMLGFKTRVSIEEGLDNCYQWYLKHNGLV